MELVRRGDEAFNRRDFDAALADAHDDLRWKPYFSVETKLLRGKAEILEAWTTQTDALDVRIDLLELTALDATRALAVGRWSGRGAGSDAPVEQVNAQVFTVEEGKLRWVETFASKREALEATGLKE